MELGLQSPPERFTNYNVHTVLAHIRGRFGMDPIWAGREDTVEGATLAVGSSKLRCGFNKIKQIA
jgi:translation initiation factor IF-1